MLGEYHFFFVYLGGGVTDQYIAQFELLHKLQNTQNSQKLFTTSEYNRWMARQIL